MEITYTEFVLFAWGVLATGYALKYKHAKDSAIFMIRLLVENEDARNQFIKAHADFIKENRA